MDCSVCGFSLDSPGYCPACGSENHSLEKIAESSEQVDIETRVTENLEIPKEESGPTPVESIVSSNDSIISIPFGITDAPSNIGSPTIPYGLDFAP